MISVIIPAYNAERYLEQCVDSLLNCYQGNVEVILVDDGSEDSTPALCDALARQNQQAMTVLHKSNGGVQTARNLGYSVSRGEWIWFVDSDDVVAPQALEKLTQTAATTKADAVYFGLARFEDGTEPDWQASSHLGMGVISASDFLSGTYTQRYGHYLWEYVFRKDVLAKMSSTRPSGAEGPCREEFSFLDDLVFTEEFLRIAGSVEVVPETLYGYRQVGASITHATSPMAADSALRAIREIDEYQVPIEDELPKALMSIGLLFNAYRAAGMSEMAAGLRAEISQEITDRVANVGMAKMPPRLLARYAALRTGIGNLILSRREKRR